MTAKNCLLCGKPLSRIRVGGGEDFCSREHRNQYRLRRGMDRLTEANKVASVMRRRENPMPLGFAPVMHEGVARAPHSAAIRIRPLARKPLMRPSLPKLEVHVPGRGNAPAILNPSSPPENPRAFALLRLRVDRERIFTRAIRTPVMAVAPPKRAAVARPPASQPQKGRALRVSLAVGFRLPKAPPRNYQPTESAARAGLAWSDAPRAVAARNIESGARGMPSPRGLASEAAAWLGASAPLGSRFSSGTEPRALGSGSRGSSTGLAYRGPVSLDQPVARLAAHTKEFAAPRTARERVAAFDPLDIHRTPAAHRVVRMIAKPVAGTPQYRIVSVPFAPQDPYAATFVQEQEYR